MGIFTDFTVHVCPNFGHKLSDSIHHILLGTKEKKEVVSLLIGYVMINMKQHFPQEKRGDAGGAAGHEEEGRGIERPRYHCRILVSWSENRVIMQCSVMSKFRSDSWKVLTPVHDFKHSSVIACLNL